MHRLLIVDDSNIIRTRIERALTGEDGGGLDDIEVIGTAKNGLAAVQMARLGHPQLVTMDLTMPEMDGLQCIQELIKLDPSVNILVVSALNDKATAIAALRYGAKGFLEKPFSDENLRLALLEVMEQ